MKMKSAEFVISSTNYKKCPNSNKIEYAFIGRSNVGKSSLINALVNQRDLAKTSSKPGKTQLINHFIVNKEWYLVDLPGYGYAKVSKDKRISFAKMINDYLINRPNLICLFVLIDARHKPQRNDQEFMRFLAINKVPFAIIFTKSDKLSEINIKKNMNFYKNEMLKEWEQLPQIFITSAKKKTGLESVSSFIEKLNKEQ